jgi:EpsI family protein
MGHIQTKKLILLTILLLVVTILIYAQPKQRAKSKGVHLSKGITEIAGWRFVEHIPLDPKVIDTLDLDDYVNMKFSNGKDIISLYIGYYFTARKIGAAHDPMVCFPGQGWKVSSIRKKELILQNVAHGKLQYASMIVEKNQRKEYIIYWFQSYNKSNSSTLFQKIAAYKNRIQHKGEDNAFVRINTSSSDIPEERAESIALQFIQAFYPVFLKYVQG